MTKEEIFLKLQDYLEEIFEIPREKVTLQSRLFEELDLDSIDAVDLVVKLQALTGRKFNPDEFKKVRTIADVVNHTYAIING